MGLKSILTQPISFKSKKNQEEEKPKDVYITFVICEKCAKSYPAHYFTKCPYCQTPNPQLNTTAE